MRRLPEFPGKRSWLVAVLSLPMVLGLLTSPARSEDHFFGNTEPSSAALEGILYDLKQDQDRQATTVDNRGYWKEIDHFLSSGWDETVLNQYFRASRPLYTTQIFIPRIHAEEGPKAFGVEHVVKPDRYVIHYKGQISPPEDGTYRFVGFADNIIAVSLDQKTVLFNDWCAIPMPKTNWQHPAPPQLQPCYEQEGRLENGRWFTLKAGDVADLDILIGEADGGASAYFLMIEKKGETYPRDRSGDPILPIFQVAPYNTPRIPPRSIGQNGPDFSSGKSWTSVQ